MKMIIVQTIIKVEEFFEDKVLEYRNTHLSPLDICLSPSLS